MGETDEARLLTKYTNRALSLPGTHHKKSILYAEESDTHSRMMFFSLSLPLPLSFCESPATRCVSSSQVQHKRSNPRFQKTLKQAVIDRKHTEKFIS